MIRPAENVGDTGRTAGAAGAAHAGAGGPPHRLALPFLALNGLTIVLCGVLVLWAPEHRLPAALALLLPPLSFLLGGGGRRHSYVFLTEVLLTTILISYVVPVVYFLAFPCPSNLSMHGAPENSGDVLVSVLCGTAALVVGARLLPKPRPHILGMKLDRHTSVLTPNILVLFWAVSAFYRLVAHLGLKLPGALDNTLLNFHLFALFGLWCLMLTGRLSAGFRAFTVFAIAWAWWLNLSAGFMSYFAQVCLVLVIAWAYYRRQIPLFVLPVGLVLLSAWMKVRPEIRELVASQGSTIESAQMLGDSVVDTSLDVALRDTRLSALERAIYRLNMGDLYGNVLRWTPDIEPFAQGETLWIGLKNATLPRFLFPDKFRIGGSSVWTAQFSGRRLLETSVSLGPMLEFYVNFGLPGVIVGMALIGWFLGSVERFAQNRTPLALATVLFVIQPYAVDFFGYFGTLTARVVLRALLVAVAVLCVSQLASGRATRPRPGVRGVPPSPTTTGSAEPREVTSGSPESKAES